MKRRKTYNKYRCNTERNISNSKDAKREKMFLKAMLFPQLVSSMTNGGYVDTDTTNKNKEEF